jgi:riboflavin kinase / FMN adenylyltransferase
VSTAAPCALTVGNFDGVHRGHRVLVARTVEAARKRGLRAVALTFDPHPAAVLRPEGAPALLQSLPERIAALEALGIAHVEVLAFDAALAALSPEDFVERVLVERLAARHVVVGANFRFGNRAAGDVALLESLGARRGFAVERVDLVAAGAGPVSSSAIRSLVADGDVEGAAHLLGRPFALTGPVVRGDGRGRGLGIPTANVAIAPGRALPADGVYAGWAHTAADAVPGGPGMGGSRAPRGGAPRHSDRPRASRTSAGGPRSRGAPAPSRRTCSTSTRTSTAGT